MEQKLAAVQQPRRFQGLLWLCVCWMVYATAYVARANLSAGFDELTLAFGVNNAYLGTMGSVFFICYAIGQMVNGYLGDRAAPERFVLLSMMGSVCTYGLALLLRSAFALPILWGINGFFLSMLWGPMLRMLYMRLGQRKRADIAMVMGTASVGGYFFAWMVFAPMFPRLGWRALVGIPLVLTGALMTLWMVVFRKNTAVPVAQWAQKRRGLRETLAYVRAHKLWGVALTSVCLGIVRENLSLLLPALFIGIMGTGAEHGITQRALLPAANLLGLFAGWRWGKILIANPKRGLIFTFLGMAVTCGILCVGFGNPKLAFIALFVLVATSYLGSCILISYIPLSHAEENMVSTLVGLFDFGNYLGAALSSVVLGALLARRQWVATILVWMVVCLLAVSMLVITGKRQRAA